MITETEKKDSARFRRTKDPEQTEKRTGFETLFESDWEVFVIKQDSVTGEYFGKTACCALAVV